MREAAEKSIGWLVLAGIVLAIIVAKRRHENKFAAAVSAAAADADASARAEMRAEFGQHVNVAVDASHRGEAVHRCDDPRACAVCAPVLLRVLALDPRFGALPAWVEGRSGWAGGDHDNYDGSRRNDDDNGRGYDDDGLVRVVRSSYIESIGCDSGGDGVDSGVGSGVGDGGDRGGRVRGLDSASVSSVNGRRGVDGDALYGGFGRGRGPGR